MRRKAALWALWAVTSCALPLNGCLTVTIPSVVADVARASGDVPSAQFADSPAADTAWRDPPQGEDVPNREMDVPSAVIDGRFAGDVANSAIDSAARDSGTRGDTAAPMDTFVAAVDSGVVADTGAGAAMDSRVVVDVQNAVIDVPNAAADAPNAAVDVPSVIADSSFPFDVSAGAGDAAASDGSRNLADSAADARSVLDASGDYCGLIVDHTPVTLYLSSDDSNSVASPAIARRMLLSGSRMQPRLVRTYEFMNYYNPTFAPAARGTVAINASMRPGETLTETSMQAAIQSESQTLAEVRPMSLTFVIDTSGSMINDFRMERAQAVIRTIAAQLRPDDIVSATTWNTLRNVVLAGHHVRGPNDPALLAMAANLRAGGDTDLDSGLAAGYAQARANFVEGRLNRVILISDGEANVGQLNGLVIGQAARRADGEEIYLVGVGVGDGVGDTLMDQVTDAGRGAYIFIDTVAEAGVMFGPRFVENMEIAVRAARLEMRLPWYMKVLATSAEAISVNPVLVDPQHLAPNDAMVFQQILRSCGPNVIDPTDTVELTATFEDRVTRQPRSVQSRTTIGALMNSPAAALRRGEAIYRYAEMLKLSGRTFNEMRAGLNRARQAVSVARALRDDPALAEISTLIERFAWVEGL